MAISLSRVLHYMDGVDPIKVPRWTEGSSPNDMWDGIWDNAEQMQAVLDLVEWASGSTTPLASAVIGIKSEYDAFIVEELKAAPKREVEKQLRNDPKLKAETALRARDEDKTIDEIIAETVAKA